MLPIGYCIRGKLYIRQIFLIQMQYRLQSMNNHVVGRAASVVSEFSSPDFNGVVVNQKCPLFYSLLKSLFLRKMSMACSYKFTKNIVFCNFLQKNQCVLKYRLPQKLFEMKEQLFCKQHIFLKFFFSDIVSEGQNKTIDFFLSKSYLTKQT